jgi:hypothetical protein
MRTTVEARIIADVCAIAGKPFVASVESSFAGHFTELGVTVKLVEGASDADVIALQNELLEYLDAEDAVRPAEFTWKVAFTRGDKPLRSLFPGDELRTSSEDLEPPA